MHKIPEILIPEYLFQILVNAQVVGGVRMMVLLAQVFNKAVSTAIMIQKESGVLCQMLDVTQMRTKKAGVIVTQPMESGNPKAKPVYIFV